VREALRGRRRVHALFVAMGSERTRSGAAELEEAVAAWLKESPRRPSLRRLAADELTALVGTTEHQGVAAEVDPYPYLSAGEVLKRHTLVVALDGVQDPHNLGAVIRTAECAGAAVVIPRHRAVEVTPAVVRASAGATEHAAVAQVRNLADFLAEAKEAGFWVYGAVAGAGVRYSAQDFTYPSCLVLGSEGQGLGRRVAGLCDVLVCLPLRGRVESLNVSVAAGILLYEVLRQREAAAAADADTRAAGAARAYPDEGG
jgi:23S rRNA (guanosine2251-2'-O)-methyltransferase